MARSSRPTCTPRCLRDNSFRCLCDNSFRRLRDNATRCRTLYAGDEHLRAVLTRSAHGGSWVAGRKPSGVAGTERNTFTALVVDLNGAGGAEHDDGTVKINVH